MKEIAEKEEIKLPPENVHGLEKMPRGELRGNSKKSARLAVNRGLQMNLASIYRV